MEAKRWDSKLSRPIDKFSDYRIEKRFFRVEVRFCCRRPGGSILSLPPERSVSMRRGNSLVGQRTPGAGIVWPTESGTPGSRTCRRKTSPERNAAETVVRIHSLTWVTEFFFLKMFSDWCLVHIHVLRSLSQRYFFKLWRNGFFLF